ncbi:MAG: hypothetical protein K0R54_1638 [Clostridiaceae bacterium]|nr:hypothetical protein [Clostridiaceae bacterium]
MKKLFIIAGIAIAIIAGIFLYSSYFSSSSIKVIVGQELSNKLNLYTWSGKKINLSNIKTKHKVIFYFSDLDSDYDNSLKTINKITKIYNDKDITYMVLWEGKIPMEKIRQYKIDLSINYSLNNKRPLALSKLGSVILDENNKVTLVSTYDYLGLVKNICSLYQGKDLVEKANKILIEDYKSNGSYTINNNKHTVLIFSNSGCKTCRSKENIILNNMELLKSKVNVITIKNDLSPSPEYDKSPVIDYSDVYFWTYSKTFNISTPPLYVILDKEGQVSNYYVEANELVGYVNKLR